jgi:Asp-tRNA(Asn)/Glu-tRNA(Gln) amidotransferase A subunit family amidase
MLTSRDSKFKQTERSQRIAALTSYQGAFTSSERQVLDKPVQELVQDVHKHVLQPIDILKAYGKAALKAHEKTNCVTEIMIPSCETWLSDGSINLKGPLAGIPVSLKDSIVVAGYDTTVGYSSKVGNKKPLDGTLVRLLKDAGAVPYVKTNLPITLLSFECTNDVWGRTTNPHNAAYSPGGSTGGEGALLAAGGGRIGIGSDVAGSVRAPAHFSGIYSLRCSTGRWPKMGVDTSMPGQEGIPSVFSPMTRTLGDLRYFTESIVGMKPWTYDHSVHPIPWRGEAAKEIQEKKKLRVGVLRSDGVIDPSPACARALNEAVEALRADGAEIVELAGMPDMYYALQLASQLLNSDGCATFKSFFRWGEWEDPAAKQMSFYMALPRPIKWLYGAWVRYVRRDPVWAGLLEDWYPRSAYQQWQLVAKREAYKAAWHAWWEKEAKVDFIITPPNATPAVPHDAMTDAVSSCGYTFLFNLVSHLPSSGTFARRKGPFADD